MPKCLEKDCLVKRPCFNLPTETNALYCNAHKKENMRNVKLKTCIEDECLKIPTYNLPTETKAIYCSAHKKENMMNVRDIKRQAINCLEQMFYCKRQKI